MIPDFLCQECLIIATNSPLELSEYISSAPSQNHCTPHTGNPGKTGEAKISPGKANCHFRSQSPFPFAALRVKREQFPGKLLITQSPYNTLPTQAAKLRLNVKIKGGTSAMSLLSPDP